MIDKKIIITTAKCKYHVVNAMNHFHYTEIDMRTFG